MMTENPLYISEPQRNVCAAAIFSIKEDHLNYSWWDAARWNPTHGWHHPDDVDD